MIEPANIDRLEFTGFPPSFYMHCPLCNYALTGLPSPDACPECGFRYDESTMLWMGNPRTRQRATLTKFVSIWLILMLGGLWLGGFSLSASNILLSVPLLLGIALLLYYTAVGFRRIPFACVSTDGVCYRYPNGRPHMIPWSQIRSIDLHAELRGHEMIIELTSGRSRYIAKAFTTTQDMRDFVAAARRRR